MKASPITTKQIPFTHETEYKLLTEKIEKQEQKRYFMDAGIDMRDEFFYKNDNLCSYGQDSRYAGFGLWNVCLSWNAEKF